MMHIVAAIKKKEYMAMVIFLFGKKLNLNLDLFF